MVASIARTQSPLESNFDLLLLSANNEETHELHKSEKASRQNSSYQG
jgi:hypothetical protein